MLGNSWYVLQEKKWYGWKTILKDNRINIFDAAKQLKSNNTVIININI